MYELAIVFALIQHDGNGRIVETHGKFADEKACEYAAAIVEQDLHPLPRGHMIECQRRGEVLVAASYNSKKENE